MRRTPTDFHFIIITLLLVSLLGVRTAYSLIDEESASADSPQLETSLPLSTANADRAPASVPKQLAVSKPSLHAMMDLDLSCAKDLHSAFKTTGQFVQFKGKNCLKNFKQEHIEIINKSNGYTASIFPFGVDQYQTDMIQLVEGENEITIRYSGPGATKYEKTIKVSSSSI